MSRFVIPLLLLVLAACSAQNDLQRRNLEQRFTGTAAYNHMATSYLVLVH